MSTPEPAAGLEIVAMTPAHAADICTWRYRAPYDCYDMTGADPADLTDPELEFHALVAGDRLVGLRSFGPDGQVPGGVYDDEALDTGGGLRPELVGKGLGRQAVAAGLAFGRARFAPPAFRVTVASFNTRALRTVEGLGVRAGRPIRRDRRRQQLRGARPSRSLSGRFLPTERTDRAPPFHQGERSARSAVWLGTKRPVGGLAGEPPGQ